MPEQLKVSDIPGYLDQIQAGGSGTEIDLSQFYMAFNGAFILFTDIYDYDIETVKINGKNVNKDKWIAYGGAAGKAIFIMYFESYPEPVSIEVGCYYEGDSATYRFSDITLKDNVLTCVNGGSGEYIG